MQRTRCYGTEFSGCRHRVEQGGLSEVRSGRGTCAVQRAVGGTMMRRAWALGTMMRRA